MILRPETALVFEWENDVTTGSWAEFETVNDDETIAEARLALEAGRTAIIGGGAAPFVKISAISPFVRKGTS